VSLEKSAISTVFLPLLTIAVLFAACDRNTDRIRVAHPLHSEKKNTVYDSGEMAGRVIFATGKDGSPAPGASIVVIDTTAGKQVLDQLQKDPDASCSKRLANMQGALMDAARASAEAGRTPPTATADADGYFMLPQVRPGTYMVVAYGRAGDVQAIWEQPAMVDPYQAVVVKLVEPLISCAAGEEQQTKTPPPLPPPNIKPIPATVPPKPKTEPTLPVPPPSTTPTPPS
jgi:hypothetical protein